MRWIVKAAMLASVSRLPFGRRVYRTAQRLLGTSDLDLQKQRLKVAELYSLALAAGRSIPGADVLEIGTGWHPVAPVLLRLMGAHRVITIDINPWLTESIVRNTLNAILNCLESDWAPATLVCNAKDLLVSALSKDGIAPMLAELSVEYRYPVFGQSTGLAPSAIDVVISNDVLEHVSPHGIRDLHREIFRVLRQGGIAIHRIATADHFSGVDSSITKGNFLKFDDAFWYWIGGSGLAYHNRLRCCDHSKLITESDFKVVIDERETDNATLRDLESGRLFIHPSFEEYSKAELAESFQRVVALKP